MEREYAPGERKQEDKRRLLEWIDNAKIETPEMLSGAGQIAEFEIKQKFESFKRWAKSQVMPL